MGTLKVGDSVKMKYGGEATVLEEFGSGGQGTVYRVRYNGKEYLSNRMGAPPPIYFPVFRS